MKPEYPRIRARLLVDPTRPSIGYPIAAMQADLSDPIATEEDRKVWLIGDDWRIALPHRCLEDVTEEDIRTAMNLPANQLLFLTRARALPDYPWISNEMLESTDAWRREAIAEAVSIPFAKAS